MFAILVDTVCFVVAPLVAMGALVCSAMLIAGARDAHLSFTNPDANSEFTRGSR